MSDVPYKNGRHASSSTHTRTYFARINPLSGIEISQCLFIMAPGESSNLRGSRKICIDNLYNLGAEAGRGYITFSGKEKSSRSPL